MQRVIVNVELRQVVDEAVVGMSQMSSNFMNCTEYYFVSLPKDLLIVIENTRDVAHRL